MIPDTTKFKMAPIPMFMSRSKREAPIGMDAMVITEMIKRTATVMVMPTILSKSESTEALIE